jgi:hypothetical protein
MHAIKIQSPFEKQTDKTAPVSDTDLDAGMRSVPPAVAGGSD